MMAQAIVDCKKMFINYLCGSSRKCKWFQGVV
jgi:hypothetical protein